MRELSKKHVQQAARIPSGLEEYCNYHSILELGMLSMGTSEWMRPQLDSRGERSVLMTVGGLSPVLGHDSFCSSLSRELFSPR